MHQSLPMSVALAAVIALATAGCGGSDQSSGSSKESTSSASATASATSSESAAPSAGANGDYSSLLIKPSDIGPEATADGPPTANPGGTTGTGQTFRTTDGNRIIVVTIGVFPDAAAAAVIQPMKDAITDKVDGQQKPVDIGSNGFMVEGPAKKKSMEVSEVVFTQGRALVDVEYDSAPGNPAPADTVLDVARKQAAAVAAGLPG